MTVGTLQRGVAASSTRLLAIAGCMVVATASALAVAITGSLLPAVAATVMGLGVILLIRPDIGTLAFLGLMWSNAPGVAARFHNVPDAAANATALLLAIPVASYLLRRQPIVVTPAFFAVLLFLAANLLSAAMSVSPGGSWVRITSFLAEGLLIYALVTNAVRTPNLLRQATWVLVLASVIMAGLSVHQEVTQAYSDSYFGFAQTAQQEDPVTLQPDPDARPRLSGPIGEQNRYAQVLVVALPLVLFGLRRNQGRWRWVLAAGGALLIVGAIALTFSRGAAVAMGVLMIILLVWRYVRLSHMVAVMCAFLLTILLIAPQFLERIDSIRAGATLIVDEGAAEPDGAILGRTTSNLAAFLVFLDHPIVGVGPGLYADEYSQDYANDLGIRHLETSRRAHNMYLEWGAEIGVIGLTAALGFLAVTVVQLAQQRRYWRARRPDYADLAGAYWLALLGYMASAVFLHLSYERYLFTLLALANAAIWILQRERTAFEKVSAPSTGFSRVGPARAPSVRAPVL